MSFSAAIPPSIQPPRAQQALGLALCVLTCGLRCTPSRQQPSADPPPSAASPEQPAPTPRERAKQVTYTKAVDAGPAGEAPAALADPPRAQPTEPQAAAARDAGAAPAKPSTPPLWASATAATWSWQAENVLQAEQQRALLGFAKAQAINLIFVQLSADFDTDAGSKSLVEFMRAAQLQGLRVQWATGNPAWALAPKRQNALNALALGARVDARLRAAGLPSAGAIVYDVEPYLLAEWKADQAAVIDSYAGLVLALRDSAKASQIELWMTLPFWFVEQPTRGTTLARFVLENSAGIVIMAYRDKPADVEQVAAPLVEAATSAQRPVIVAVETKCIEPTNTSFCGESEQDFTRSLGDLHTRLASQRAVRGIAVHEYLAWQDLIRGQMTVMSK